MGNSVDGMFELMETVDYSLMYDLNIPRFWYSEYYYLYPDGTDDNRFSEKGKICLDGNPENAGYFKDYVIEDQMFWENRNRDDADVWYTVHRSVIDYENKVIYLTSQGGEKVFEFSVE